MQFTQDEAIKILLCGHMYDSPGCSSLSSRSTVRKPLPP